MGAFVALKSIYKTSEILSHPPEVIAVKALQASLGGEKHTIKELQRFLQNECNVNTKLLKIN